MLYTVNNGKFVGMLFLFEDLDDFAKYGNDTEHQSLHHEVSRQPQAMGCPGFVQDAISLFQCDGTADVDEICVSTATAAYKVALANAQGEYDLAKTAANVI